MEQGIGGNRLGIATDITSPGIILPYLALCMTAFPAFERHWKGQFG